VLTLAASHASLVLSARRASDSSAITNLTVISVLTASVDAILAQIAIVGRSTTSAAARPGSRPSSSSRCCSAPRCRQSSVELRRQRTHPMRAYHSQRRSAAQHGPNFAKSPTASSSLHREPETWPTKSSGKRSGSANSPTNRQGSEEATRQQAGRAAAPAAPLLHGRGHSWRPQNSSAARHTGRWAPEACSGASARRDLARPPTAST
jgi:hypothetical protein